MEGPMQAELSELAEVPEEEEMEFYHQLERRGWSCGVHDPDFAAPLEGTLHLERGLRYMLRLECEDESLNVEAKKVAELRAELRDGVASGCGVALVDAGGSGGVLCVLVADCEEERGLLVSVLHRLRDDPRAFRRAQRRPLLGCLPLCACAGALPACAQPRARASRASSAPAAGAAAAAAAPPGAARGRSASSMSRASSRTSPSVRTAALEEARAHAQGLWERALRMQGSNRSSSFSALTANMRRASAASRTSEGSAKGRAAAAAAPASRLLDATACASLLGRLLHNEDPGRLASLAKLFGQGSEGAGLGFAEFWDVCVQMLLVFPLCAEPSLEKYLQEGGTAGMTLEKWRWFLVQVQDEERAVVEAAEAQLSAMSAPDVDGDGRLTLVGLSKYLCSTSNSIFRPSRCEVHQDMTRPLAEYWISSAHHVHADPPAALSGMNAGGCSDSCWSDGTGAPVHPLSATIRSGCRCLGLALVSDGDRGGLCVLLQRERAPLAEVLAAIDESGFEKTQLPLLLVLHLGLLPLARCGEVPGALSEALGRRLWRGACAELPSPAEASGRVVVVLSPAALGEDPALDAEPPPALRGGAPGAAAPGGAEEAAEALQAWQDAGRDFAVWPGESLAHAQPGAQEVRVGFLASDELQALEAAEREQLAERGRSGLSLVYPMAPRCAPANFNAAEAWAAGVQMAALSFRAGSGDAAALAHAGRFGLENGGCGYVLKPPHLRPAGGPHDAEAPGPAPVRLELRILAARAVQSAGPLAVAVSIWGAPGDCARKVYRPVRPAGPVVTWPEADAGSDGTAPKAMEFSIASPCTALLVVELLELDARMGGARRACFYAAPVDGLRQGLRWVPLWAQGQGGEVAPTGCGSLAGLLAHVATMRLRRA